MSTPPYLFLFSPSSLLPPPLYLPLFPLNITTVPTPQKERIEAERAERERKAEGDAATPTEEVQEPVRAPSPVSPFPDDVYEEWEPKTVEVDAVTAEIADCERQLSETLVRTWEGWGAWGGPPKPW